MGIGVAHMRSLGALPLSNRRDESGDNEWEDCITAYNADADFSFAWLYGMMIFALLSRMGLFLDRF
jgi:hypothetical protein